MADIGGERIHHLCLRIAPPAGSHDISIGGLILPDMQIVPISVNVRAATSSQENSLVAANSVRCGRILDPRCCFVARRGADHYYE